MLSKAGTENSGCTERFKIPKRCYHNLRGAERLAVGTLLNTLTVQVLLEVSSKEKLGHEIGTNAWKWFIYTHVSKKSKLLLHSN